MSPRYIIMKEPRRNRLAQETAADVHTAPERAVQPEQKYDEWTIDQIVQQSIAQEALTQVPEQNAIDSAVSLDQV